MKKLWSRGGTLDAVPCGVCGFSGAVDAAWPTALLLPLPCHAHECLEGCRLGSLRLINPKICYRALLS